MDQRLNFGSEVRELKLGSTFTSGNNARTSFHTLKYDFKPASVDLSKVATLDVSSNNQVTVTVPNMDSSGQPKTVFRGNQRNYAKECVLIIDKVTGVITLEKLSHNIQVKKTRTESHKPSALPPSQPPPQSQSSSQGGGPGPAASSTSSAPPPPPTRAPLENSTQRTVSKTRVSTGSRKNTLGSIMHRHSPIQGSPSYPHHKSPQQAPAWNANNTQSTLPSIPLIGMDDDVIMPSHPETSSYQQHHQQSSNSYQQQQHKQPTPPQQQQHHHHNTSAMSVSNHPQKTTPNHYQQQQQQQQHHQQHHHQQQQQQQLHHRTTSPLAAATNQHNHLQQPQHNQLPSAKPSDVGVLSTSDSSSDSDSSGSGSDSDDDNDAPGGGASNAASGHHHGHHQQQQHHHHNHHNSHNNNAHSNKPPMHPGGMLPALLDEDLRLSESNSSDSD